MVMVACRNVGAAYNGRRVLQGINLLVAGGEWVAIIGPNGAGKSTLLRVIAGTLPGSGAVELDGRPVGSLARRQLSRLVAVVPQNAVIPRGVPVLDYVLLGRTPYISFWGAESAEDLRRTRRMLERLEIADLAGRSIDHLSGGELQRAVLARALVQEPEVLLLDEPTTALDLGHQQQVLDLVDELRRERGLAVISAVHDLTLAAQYADRLMLIDGGAVVAEGEAEAVIDPDVLARHYRASVTVLRDDEGRLVVVPVRGGSRGGSKPTQTSAS